MTSVLEQAGYKAGVLAEALPYIRSYRGRTVVVKVGGAPLDDPAHAAVVADDLALLVLVGIRVVVVHGGGPQVTTAMKEAGIETRFVGGLRYTGEDSVEIVQRVLTGSINPGLVARLNAAGIEAVGCSGIDAGLLRSEAVSAPGGEQLGRVGRVSEVNAGYLNDLLDGGYTPVVASIGVDATGHSLNVNADEVAGAVAAAIGASKVVFLTNVEGLYRDLGDSGSLISEMKSDELQALLPDLSTGMRPKVQAALHALGAGVPKAHILDGRIEHAVLLEIFTDSGIGTQVTP